VNRLDIIDHLAKTNLGGPAERLGKSITSAVGVVFRKFTVVEAEPVLSELTEYVHRLKDERPDARVEVTWRVIEGS
jgi:hypothetical protein